MSTENQTENNNATEPTGKVFNSINEIITDEYFFDFAKKNLYEVLKKRRDRPSPPQGMHYKRDWYDRMSDAGNLNITFFLTHIESIWLKKSNLNSEFRNIIQFVCDNAYIQTVSAYETLYKDETFIQTMAAYETKSKNETSAT